MSKEHEKCLKTSSAQCDDFLTNVMAMFVVPVPAELGWWHIVLAHLKRRNFRTDDLFLHFGTALGLPDRTMDE